MCGFDGTVWSLLINSSHVLKVSHMCMESIVYFCGFMGKTENGLFLRRSEEGSEHLPHAETSTYSGASGDIQL